MERMSKNIQCLDFWAEIGLVNVAQGNDANTRDLPETTDFVPAHTADLCPRPDADYGQSHVIVGASGS